MTENAGMRVARRFGAVGVVVALVCLASGRRAAAGGDELVHAPDFWEGSRLYLQGRLGYVMPMGVVGASAEWSFGRIASLSGGVAANSLGAQTSAMANVRLGHASRWVPSAGLGLSVGGFRDGHTRWDRAIVGYLDVGLEIRTPVHDQVRLSVGLGRLLNPGAGSCDDDFTCSEDEKRAHMFPCLTMVVGFDLFGAR
jgi:hypothetical protein